MPDTVVQETPPMFSDKILSRLEIPGEGSRDLRQEANKLVSSGGEVEFPFKNGVPSLYFPADGDDQNVTEKVKSFYEENPFPNYEGMEEFGELVNKGSQNPFSAQLLHAIGYNKTILECGGGTGQLSHFLQLNNNHVLGIDLSISSLGLAIEHKVKNELTRSNFAQMNIFNLAIKDNSFDVVISHGVLHHTYNARLAFSNIVKKLKPGGIIMVGLYNKYGRIPTYLRSKLIRILGPNIDFVVRNRINDERNADIWIKDQYYNPHETWHSLDEVLEWFDENGLEYVNASPAIQGTDGETYETLFSQTYPGNFYQRFVTQLTWIGTIAREGGFFDVIGRKTQK